MFVMIISWGFKFGHQLEDVLIFGLERMGHTAMDHRGECIIGEL
jgi:hypothetical protein